MTYPTVIGVDPGKEGAIAAVDVATRGLVWCEDMPTGGAYVSGALVGELFNREPRALIVCEQVGNMGNANGGNSLFSLGTSFGVVIGAAGALGRPFELIAPSSWKAAMRLSSDKTLSLGMAQRRWPEHAHLFRHKVNADRAEAALIALCWIEHRLSRQIAAPLTPDEVGAPW